MDPLWAALTAPDPKDHPNCVWKKQIESSIQWFITFSKGNGTKLDRVFSLDAYNRVGTVIEMGTDASPWGIGGWLAVNGTITHYFASQLTNEDAKKFSCPLENADGQQVWEALAVLVAIDLWASHWKDKRVVLKVRSDNVTALTLLVKKRPPSGSPIAIIPRGIALRLVHLSFPPDAEHIPGSLTC